MNKENKNVKMKYKKIRKESLKSKFKRIHGYPLNIDNPQTLSEKIQWIKRFGNLQRFSPLVDKFAVRQYVQEKIGNQYLIPLIGVYKGVEDINKETLPNSFIMKANHGCGWNILVKDKSKMSWDRELCRMRKWLQMDYSKLKGESNYRNIKPRIVIEELISDSSGDLKDYKFFCFHGQPKFIQVDGNRYHGHKRDLYDLNWAKIPIRYGYRNLDVPEKKPEHLYTMIELVKKLSNDFAFVRVDLYYTNDQIYFGELTFTPANGLKKFTPMKYDKLFGQYLDLSKYDHE